MYGEKKVESKSNKFLKLYTEKEDINQYWFSDESSNHPKLIPNLNTNPNSKIAFVSTPSIFFSLEPSLRDQSYLFDLDDRLIKRHPNAFKFDFNNFEELSKEEKILSQFDFVVVDPPYINEPSWTKFAEFVNLIANKENVKILTCSIAENSLMLEKLLNLKMKKYQPSIPHLVYQYNFFANYEDEKLDEINSEIVTE